VPARNAHPFKESSMTNSAPPPEFRQMPALRRRLHAVLRALALVLGLGTLLPSQATVITLTFEELGEDVPISNQYASWGFTFSGANAITAPVLGLSAYSGQKIAYSPTGLIAISTSLANIQSVSLYVTGPKDIGLYAYDIADNLLGFAATDSFVENQLLSISTNVPITKITIHDGGAAFAIDDLTWVTDQPSSGSIPEPTTLWMLGIGLLGLVGVTRRK